MGQGGRSGTCRAALAVITSVTLPALLAMVACGNSGSSSETATPNAGDAGTSQRPAADSSSNDSPSPHDAATSVDAADGGLDDWSEAGTCNGLVAAAPFVPVLSVAQPLPSMTGGVVDPGTYDLTKLEFFQGSDGDAGPPTDARAQTWRVGPAVDGGLALEMAGASRDGSGVIGRGRSSLVLVPAAGPAFVMKLERSCPSPAVAVDVAYTATGTGAGATLQYTFTSYAILYTFTKR